MDLDTLVAQSADAVGALITKPKMAAKLLSKPPFRFLHDVVTAITQTTGFGEGLMNAEESDSNTITEKNAKIAYLEKIINFVGVCTVSIDLLNKTRLNVCLTCDWRSTMTHTYSALTTLTFIHTSHHIGSSH